MMDANAVLQGFLSADAARIRGAAFEVLYAKHDAAKLAPLLPYADNCQCTRCQQEFKVSEGEGHCLWWHWQVWT